MAQFGGATLCGVIKKRFFQRGWFEQKEISFSFFEPTWWASDDPDVASPPITSRSSRPTPRFLRTIQRCLPVTAANQWQIRKNIYLPHPSTHMSKLWSPVNANFGIKSILAQQVQTDPEKAEPAQLEAVESVFYWKHLYVPRWQRVNDYFGL